jgi:hypothetical protein
MKKLISILIVLLTFNACKDDCPVEPDPCSEYPEEMEITLMWPNYLQRTSQETPFVPTTDTAFSIFQLLIYKTNFEYDSVFWQVGNDPRIENSPSYSIEFQDVGEITTRAICYRDTNRVCFGPDDDGIDTLYKTITMHHDTDAEILGTYRGTNDGESDSFNLRIWYDTLASGAIYPSQAGLPKDYKGIDGIKIERFNIYGGTLSSEISEYHYYGRLQPDGNTIKVYWKTLKSDGQNRTLGPQRVYTGIRIN